MPDGKIGIGLRSKRYEPSPWLSGLLIAPFWCLLFVVTPAPRLSKWQAILAVSLLAPLPGLIALPPSEPDGSPGAEAAMKLLD